MRDSKDMEPIAEVRLVSKRLEGYSNKKSRISSLIKIGIFYIDPVFLSSPLPNIISIRNNYYYRYMDRIFSPAPIHKLTSDQSKKLCDIRLSYFHDTVNDAYNDEILNTLLHPIDNKIPENVLDFGCGNGVYTERIRKFFPNAKISGVDISAKAIQAAKVNQKISWFKIDENKRLPFSDDSFEIIISTFVMHFDISSNLIGELRRVLKKRGVFIFNIFNKRYLTDDFFEKMKDAGFALREIRKSDTDKNSINILAKKY